MPGTLPGMQEKLKMEVCLHYTLQVNEIKGKVYYKGMTSPLTSFNFLMTILFNKRLSGLIRLSDKGEEEELVEEPQDDQTIGNPDLPAKSQTNKGGLVENNTLMANKEPPTGTTTAKQVETPTST